MNMGAKRQRLCYDSIMMHVYTFLTSLILPALAIRLFVHARHPNINGAPTLLRTPRIHHAHLGIGIIIIGVSIMLFSDNKIASAFFLGLGLSLVLDEFTPSLHLPQQEPANTNIYLGSHKSTMMVFAVVTSLILLLSLLKTI